MPFKLLDRPVQLDPVTRDLRVDPRNESPLWYPGQSHIWKRGGFTVPRETTEQAVQDAAPNYRKKYGEFLESQEGGGFVVLGFDGPHLDEGVVARGVTDPDRRRYVLWAQVRRRPVTIVVDAPDADIPIYQNAGFRLK